MKKLLSLLLCIMMLAALVIPAVAATEPEETVWEEESDTVYFEMVTVDPEAFTYEGAVIQWETNPDGSFQVDIDEDTGEVLQVQPYENAVIQGYYNTDGAIISEGAISVIPDMQYQGTMVESATRGVGQINVLLILILVLLAAIIIVLLSGGLVLGVGIVIVAIVLIGKAIGKKKNKKEETVCEES